MSQRDTDGERIERTEANTVTTHQDSCQWLHPQGEPQQFVFLEKRRSSVRVSSSIRCFRARYRCFQALERRVRGRRREDRSATCAQPKTSPEETLSWHLEAMSLSTRSCLSLSLVSISRSLSLFLYISVRLWLSLSLLSDLCLDCLCLPLSLSLSLQLSLTGKR